LSVGRDNFLALRKDGTVFGWGENGWGKTNVPATATNVVAIAAGAMHCLALIRDGTVVGWGYNYFGETTGVSTYPVSVTNGFVALGGVRLSNVVAIAAGEYHSVALKDDGTVVTWGDNSYGQRNVPAGLSNVVAIASGGSEGANHCLALRGDGTVVAWGWDAYGQTNVPAGLSNVVAISAGGGHSLALVGDGPPIIQVRLNTSQWSSGRFSVLAPAESGRVYGLEYKDTLATGQWQPLPLAAGVPPTLTLSDSTATNSSRVYRVRRW